MRLGEIVTTSLNSLFQNILVTGSIGSGKTSGAISNITEQLIKGGFGGLILDAKGNFVDNVKLMCKKCGRTEELQIVSTTSNCYFELLDKNISAQEMSNRLRRVIELLSPNNNSDTYWLDKVENVLLNLIILMDYYTNRNRNLGELHKLVTSKNHLKEKIDLCASKLLDNPPQDKICFELNNAILFLNEEYLNLDSRVFSIITSEITRLTIPLVTDYDVYNRFLVYDSKKDCIDFYSNPNKIIILSINIGENKSLCKILATFLKLSYQKYILSTLKNPKKFPNFLIADEFQEFVNVDDSHFLSLSREAKCINVMSTQSYTSLKNALRDENATAVIIQNFVNKIWFRNDDNYTISEAIKQLGKIEKTRENISITENAQESSKYFLRAGFKNRKSSISNGINYVLNKENEYDENFFTRELKTFEALAFIQNKGKHMQPTKVKFNIWR
ncbi:MAG: type IV secretion system DNA-binding domain-containing protein [Clostridia bacterium]|nr:type IV secretion system DNA-binding domain-containing protein [Clostridia bacterium]